MRKNKNTDIIFQNIFTNELLVGKLDRFVSAGNAGDPYLQKYQEIVRANKKSLEELAELEEIILQLNCWTGLTPDDLSITLNNDYVYVRTAFYRADKTAKEIRVPVGSISSWIEAGADIEDLPNNETFNVEALEKIKKAMEGVIHINIKTYRNKYETVKIK